MAGVARMRLELEKEFVKSKKFCPIRRAKSSDVDSRFNVSAASAIAHCDEKRKKLGIHLWCHCRVIFVACRSYHNVWCEASRSKVAVSKPDWEDHESVAAHVHTCDGWI